MPRLRIAPGLSQDEKFRQLDQWLQHVHEKGRFNGTVLIARNGEVLYERCLGCADVEGKVPLCETSSFNLASVSKQFTAMGILLLAHRGQLDLEDSIAKYLPELRFYEDVRIRHLLHHTSGLCDYIELAEDNWDRSQVFSIQSLLELLQKYRPELEFEPGSEFEYSNTGYVLLAAIIERVSGQSFADFMHGNIFGPLEMNDTRVFNRFSPPDSLKDRVFGFRKRFWGRGKHQLNDLNYLDGVVGDGGIYSSARDLVKWDKALDSGVLVPKETYEAAYVSGRLNDGTPTGYGFGWNVEQPGIAMHGGDWQGFWSMVRRNLYNRTLLVVLDNSSNGRHAEAIAEELEDFVDEL